MRVLPELQRVIVLDNGGCACKLGFHTNPDDVRYASLGLLK